MSSNPSDRSVIGPSSAKISTKNSKGSPTNIEKVSNGRNQQSVIVPSSQNSRKNAPISAGSRPPGQKDRDKRGEADRATSYANSGRNASIIPQQSPSRVYSKIPQQERERNQSLTTDPTKANYNKHKNKEKKRSRVKSEPLSTTLSRMVSKKSREASKGGGSKSKKGSKSEKKRKRGSSEADLNIDENPTALECPHCHNVITTRIEKAPKTIAFIVCCLSIGLCCFCGCCLIPFYLNSMNDIRHICPECGFVIGIYYT